MPDTKLKLKDPGTIHLMALDTSSLFLPFGRPIADYLRGAVTPQNGSRAVLNQGAIEFSPVVRWTESMSALLRTTGFGELERDGLSIAEVATEPEVSDPGVAGFLSFDEPEFATSAAGEAKISPAIASDDIALTLPRISALPLRPRMTLGPAPASKVKPAPVVSAPKPVAAPAAKAGPGMVPKASPPPPPPAAPKPVAAPVPPTKVAAAPPVQPKPVTTVAPPPPAPVSKPTMVPAPKPVAPVAPAARAPEAAPVQPKLIPTPVRPVAPSRPAENTAEAPAPVKPAPVAPKTPTPLATPKPPVISAPPAPAANRPAARTQWADTVEPPARQATAREVPKEIPREKEPETRPKAGANLSLPSSSSPIENTSQTSQGPHLGIDDSESGGFLAKIPMPARLGIGLLLAVAVIYFLFGRGSGEKAPEPQASVSMGEQGWSTEWASDTGGSKRGRQLTLYRPSTGMTDYQFKFVGQIESKALGWVFRAADTKNYYAMKIENLRPGVMAISHLAVVEGRESSYSQKPVNIDARPGAAYRVTVDITGPRFTVNVNSEPVDFWTDNRIKAGAVGFMNERDERGASSSVQFSFPQRGR